MNTVRIMVTLTGGASLALLTLLGLYLQTPTCEAFYIDDNHSPSPAHWSYADQSAWSRGYAQCGATNRRQSPIDIKHQLVIPNDQLVLRFINYDKRIRFKISNAHHTVKLNPIIASTTSSVNKDQGSSQPFDINTADDEEHEHSGSSTLDNNKNPASSLSDNQAHDHDHSDTSNNNNDRRRRYKDAPQSINNSNNDAAADNQVLDLSGADSNNNEEPSSNSINDSDVPMIKLEWMGDWINEYRLHDIHFHWGASRDSGSEHLVDGRRSAMEMHLVHIKKGLDKERISIEPDSVAVIAVLVESNRKSNANFNPIVNTLISLNMSDTPAQIEFNTIYDLMPQNLQNFYTYQGSLTTPPCYEVVNWIVMQQRIYINAKQMELFRNLYARSGHDDGGEQAHQIMPNFRQTQNSSGRVIMASFSPSTLNEVASATTTPCASWLVVLFVFGQFGVRMRSVQLLFEQQQ